MSTTMAIIIGVLAVVVIGGLIYFGMATPSAGAPTTTTSATTGLPNAGGVAPSAPGPLY